MTRNSMKRQFDTTVRKFLATWPRLSVCASPERRGSLNSSNTAKNMAKTLNAAMPKTFSTLRCWCTHPARKGPKAPPMFTRV